MISKLKNILLRCKLGFFFAGVYSAVATYLLWYSLTCKTQFCGLAMLWAFSPWVNNSKVVNLINVIATYVEKHMAQNHGWYLFVILILMFALVWFVIGVIMQMISDKIGLSARLSRMKAKSAVAYNFIIFYLVMVLFFSVLESAPFTSTGKFESTISAFLMMPALLVLLGIDKLRLNPTKYLVDQTFGILFYVCAVVNALFYYFTITTLSGYLRKRLKIDENQI